MDFPFNDNCICSSNRTKADFHTSGLGFSSGLQTGLHRRPHSTRQRHLASLPPKPGLSDSGLPEAHSGSPRIIPGLLTALDRQAVQAAASVLSSQPPSLPALSTQCPPLSLQASASPPGGYHFPRRTLPADHCLSHGIRSLLCGKRIPSCC